MRVVRYSKTGFKPRYQSHHLQHILFELTGFDEKDIKSPYRRYIRRYIRESHEKLVKLYTKNFDDFRYGIWCFKEGYSIGPELNHLRESKPRFVADLDENTEVYDVNLHEIFKLKDYPYGAMYVPKRSLKSLSNIHREPKSTKYTA